MSFGIIITKEEIDREEEEEKAKSFADYDQDEYLGCGKEPFNNIRRGQNVR